MHERWSWWLALWLGWACLGCSTLKEERLEVHGVINYRHRVAMPADAVVVVDLVDLTVSEQQPPVLASRKIENPGSVPVFYQLEYGSEVLRRGHRLAVHARIVSGGKDWMVTGTVNHFMDRGRLVRADVQLKPAK